MAQYARPDSDYTVTNWTDQAAGTTNLYAVLDESSANDADYITVGIGAPGSYGCTLSNVTDPGVSTGHVVRWRSRITNRVDDEFMVNIRLRDATYGTVANVYGSTILNTAWQTRTYTLSEAEADLISDYTALEVEIDGNIIPGDDTGATIDVSWVEVEVPDASGTATPVLAAPQYRRRRG